MNKSGKLKASRKPCHLKFQHSETLSLSFRIKHDNVVGLEDFYETRTHYYLVMELYVSDKPEIYTQTQSYMRLLACVLTCTCFRVCEGCRAESCLTVFWTEAFTQKKTPAV